MQVGFFSEHGKILQDAWTLLCQNQYNSADQIEEQTYLYSTMLFSSLAGEWVRRGRIKSRQWKK